MKVLNLRSLMKSTSRRSGRTSELILYCLEFLNQSGPGRTLGVVTKNTSQAEFLCREVRRYCSSFLEVATKDKVKTIGGATILFLSLSTLESRSCGVKFADIYFDAPELFLFGEYDKIVNMLGPRLELQ